MSITIQVISSHPVLTRAVSEILFRLTGFSARTLPPVSDEAEAKRSSSLPRLFLLDACSLQTDLGPLAVRVRAHSPASKFLVLLPPASNNHAEKIRLFYWGIDGFVDLHETWQTELPLAIRCILQGQVWVPPEVLATFVMQVRALLNAQLMPGHSLTAREGQVLQLLMRSLTNKEISAALGISERTAKFHVSNVLTKLNLEDRRGVLPDRFMLSELPSGLSE